MSTVMIIKGKQSGAISLQLPLATAMDFAQELSDLLTKYKVPQSDNPKEDEVWIETIL